MRPDPKPVRHAVLFELLRQQNLSETTSERLRHLSPSIGRGEALLLQIRAARSWAGPGAGRGTARACG